MAKMATKHLKILILLLTLAPVLGGCYIPTRFDAEIEIDRRGYYSLIFDGYLVDSSLYDGLRKGKISAAAEQAKVALIKKDLVRDSAVKEFKYFKKGRFRVKWQKKGDLLKDKMITFLRRNEKFLTIKYDKKHGVAIVEGSYVAKSMAKQLIDAGLSVQGEIRVKTNSRIVSQNAGKIKGDVKGRGEKTLIWKVNGFSNPRPRMSVVLR